MNFPLNTESPNVSDPTLDEALGLNEPDMRDKKLWVAITAHNPLARINPLLNVLREYAKFPCQVHIYIYINYDAQDCVPDLQKIVDTVPNITVEIVVASPSYEHWYLTWAHKTDLALAILNRKADYYIYQENDMLIRPDNFLYWVKWKPRLNRIGLEPGFLSFENYSDKQVPFDNHFPYSLIRETPKIWGDVGFTVPKILVIDRDVNFFVQLANPYYGAMILDQADGEEYIYTRSFDPEASYSRVGIRNWPIADRSSMGLAFENVPDGFEHRRCVPVCRQRGVYRPHIFGMIRHDDTKYSKDLDARQIPLMDCRNMLSLT